MHKQSQCWPTRLSLAFSLERGERVNANTNDASSKDLEFNTNQAQKVNRENQYKQNLEQKRQ